MGTNFLGCPLTACAGQSVIDSADCRFQLWTLKDVYYDDFTLFCVSKKFMDWFSESIITGNNIQLFERHKLFTVWLAIFAIYEKGLIVPITWFSKLIECLYIE